MINKNMQAILTEIKKAKKIALFHHINIDGDSFSSSYGLLLALRSKYPKKEIVWVADTEYMEERFEFLEYDASVVVREIDETYLSIVGDTSSHKIIYKYEQYKKGYKNICFDHHQNNPSIKFDIFWQESSFVASSMQAYMIAKAVGPKWSEEIAFNLALGILTDSGNFVYSFADEKPVAMFAELLKYISDEKMDNFYKSIRNRSMESFAMKKYMLENVKFNGKVAYVYISEKDMKNKPHLIDIKSNINTIGNIAQYSIWSIIMEVRDENNNKYIKINLRTNGPDISKLAIKYNGGGHKRAGGCKVNNATELKIFMAELNAIK